MTATGARQKTDRMTVSAVLVSMGQFSFAGLIVSERNSGKVAEKIWSAAAKRSGDTALDSLSPQLRRSKAPSPLCSAAHSKLSATRVRHHARRASMCEHRHRFRHRCDFKD